MNHTVDGRNPSRTTVQKPYDSIPCKQGGAGFRPSTWGVCLGLLFNLWFSNIPDSPVLLRGKKTPWAVRINENTSKNKRLLSDLGIGVRQNLRHVSAAQDKPMCLSHLGEGPNLTTRATHSGYPFLTRGHVRPCASKKAPCASLTWQVLASRPLRQPWALPYLQLSLVFIGQSWVCLFFRLGYPQKWWAPPPLVCLYNQAQKGTLKKDRPEQQPRSSG